MTNPLKCHHKKSCRNSNKRRRCHHQRKIMSSPVLINVILFSSLLQVVRSGWEKQEWKTLHQHSAPPSHHVSPSPSRREIQYDTSMLDNYEDHEQKYSKHKVHYDMGHGHSSYYSHKGPKKKIKEVIVHVPVVKKVPVPVIKHVPYPVVKKVIKIKKVKVPVPYEKKVQVVKKVLYPIPVHHHHVVEKRKEKRKKKKKKEKKPDPVKQSKKCSKKQMNLRKEVREKIRQALRDNIKPKKVMKIMTKTLNSLMEIKKQEDEREKSELESKFNKVLRDNEKKHQAQNQKAQKAHQDPLSLDPNVEYEWASSSDIMKSGLDPMYDHKLTQQTKDHHNSWGVKNSFLQPMMQRNQNKQQFTGVPFTTHAHYNPPLVGLPLKHPNEQHHFDLMAPNLNKLNKNYLNNHKLPFDKILEEVSIHNSKFDKYQEDHVPPPDPNHPSSFHPLNQFNHNQDLRRMDDINAKSLLPLPLQLPVVDAIPFKPTFVKFS